MHKYILIIFTILPTLLYGQAQDCGFADVICDEFFQQASPAPGEGFVNDLTNYAGCMANGENNSNWYIFTIQTSGDLLFDITPDINADYDFTLFRLSTPGGNTYTCADIASGALTEIRCNYSGAAQTTTGLRAGYTNTTSTPSGPLFCAPLAVVQGETFMLIVDKYSTGAVGYSLDFRPSTASITDIEPPVIDDANLGPSCVPVDTIEIFFNEPILCSTLNSDSIRIAGPQATNVIDVYSRECFRGQFAQSAIVVVDPPIYQGGNYRIIPKGISDKCGNIIDSVLGAYPFSLYEIPVVMDSFELGIGCLADTFFFFNISEGVISSVLWDFGDNTTSTQNNPVHIYNDLGDYTVTLTVSSPDNCSTTKTRDITVVNSFQASFTVGSENICVGDEVQFTDETRGGANTWEWDFGDGSPLSTDENPVHIFQNSGDFVVKLLASDNLTPGCAPDSFRVTVEVAPSASASFAVEDTACQSQFVRIDSISQNPSISDYFWDFGDGSTSTSNNPDFFYTNTGEFTIELIVVDAFCGSDTFSSNLFVKPSPQFNLGNDTSICVSDEYVLRVVDDVDGILWSNGSTEDFLVVSDFPAQISVEVLKNGCTTTDQVFIGAKPDGCYLVNVPSAFTPNSDGMNDVLKILPTRILEFEMRVYNRWGELLYENPGNFNQGWDGTYKGQPQEVGVYTYFVKAIGMDGRVIRQSGNVTLLR